MDRRDYKKTTLRHDDQSTGWGPSVSWEEDEVREPTGYPPNQWGNNLSEKHGEIDGWSMSVTHSDEQRPWGQWDGDSKSDERISGGGWDLDFQSHQQLPWGDWDHNFHSSVNSDVADKSRSRAVAQTKFTSSSWDDTPSRSKGNQMKSGWDAEPVLKGVRLDPRLVAQSSATERCNGWERLPSPKRDPVADSTSHITYEGDPVVIERKADVDMWCDTIRKFGVKVLGFDTEWKPDRYSGSDNKVALLQLCFRNNELLGNSSHTVLLIRTFKIGVSKKLRSILEDPGIIKAGVNLTQDIIKLQDHFGVEVQGSMDLDIEYNKMHEPQRKQRLGTKDLVKIILGLQMAKPKSLQRLNWERPLTYMGIQYAALDAYVSSRIYEELIENQKVDVELEG